MSVFVIGGTGFIGYRLVRLLAAQGHTVTCMDADPGAHSFADLGDRVTSLRGDVGSSDDVMAAMAAARPERVVNLAYLIGSRHPPHAALRVNVLGMGNCFEAARILGVRHVVYAGSFAANGPQANYGERPVTEDDPVHPDDQYSRHKVTNEWQALDYIEKHGMRITGVRTSYVTGQDKVRGSVHHVRCITEPALGRPVTLPFRDMMQCVLHVDDMAGVFARVLIAESPAHRVYNSGGTTVSLGDIADTVRFFLPDARIDFERESGARGRNSTYLLDNSRLLSEFGIRFRPFAEQVLQVIDDTRRRAGLPAVGGAGRPGDFVWPAKPVPGPDPGSAPPSPLLPGRRRERRRGCPPLGGGQDVPRGATASSSPMMGKSTMSQGAFTPEPVVLAGEAEVAEAAHVVGTGLNAFNDAVTGTPDRLPLAVVVRDPDTGEVVGGATGRSSLGLLFIDLFHLPEKLRGGGLGGRILRLAEEEGRRRGCRAAVLMTISFQAPGFYERHGWRRFGEVACHPPGTSRVFMAKEL